MPIDLLSCLQDGLPSRLLHHDREWGVLVRATNDQREYAAGLDFRSTNLERARKAANAHRCRRETPIAWRNGDALIQGVIDLAFEEGTRWTLVDFKTDEEFRSAAPYQRQLGLYALAVEQACSTSVEAFLVKI
jgi:ATP-dependent exoDNAse (exonuclease V) beta subunit